MQQKQILKMFANNNPIFWNDDDDEVIDIGLERIPRRPYTFFKRISLDHWDDVDFVSRFRLRKETVVQLLQLIDHRLRYDQERFVLSFFSHLFCRELIHIFQIPTQTARYHSAIATANYIAFFRTRHVANRRR